MDSRTKLFVASVQTSLAWLFFPLLPKRAYSNEGFLNLFKNPSQKAATVFFVEYDCLLDEFIWVCIILRPTHLVFNSLIIILAEPKN